jgi:hypothetical protein
MITSYRPLAAKFLGCEGNFNRTWHSDFGEGNVERSLSNAFYPLPL